MHTFMVRFKSTAVIGLLLVGLGLSACGGGNGIGPDEIRKRENALRDKLPVSWDLYNATRYSEAIDAFTNILQDADNVEGIDNVRNEIKAEAQDGIGWSFFRLQRLEEAALAFEQATRLDRDNADAWVGGSGVALARKDYGRAVQFATQAMEIDPTYSSATRADGDGRLLTHDDFDVRQLRILLAEAYFQRGLYSAFDRADPNNSAAQLRFLDGTFRFSDPGQLLDSISQAAAGLQRQGLGEG
jgi:tetratricopeptide (TPR) repeat protein